MSSQSGLLAAVAAQLLSFFQSGDAFNRRQTSQGGKDTVLALCYVALLLNIAATISALLIIDKMGALPVRGASLPPTNAGHFPGNPMHILGEYGGSRSWRYVIWHCEYHQNSSSSHGANRENNLLNLKGCCASLEAWCAWSSSFWCLSGIKNRFLSVLW